MFMLLLHDQVFLLYSQCTNRSYQPLTFFHFDNLSQKSKSDSRFRTKPQLALVYKKIIKGGVFSKNRQSQMNNNLRKPILEIVDCTGSCAMVGYVSLEQVGYEQRVSQAGGSRGAQGVLFPNLTPPLLRTARRPGSQSCYAGLATLVRLRSSRLLYQLY